MAPTLTRRTLIAGTATALLAAPPLLRAATPPFDPADPRQVRHALRRMRFSTTADTFYWWMRGTRFAVIDMRPVPLFEMHIGSILRCRDVGDDFEVTSLEIVINTDPATGAVVERWPNPFTGETVDLRLAPVGPTTVRYGPQGPVMAAELPGSRIDKTSRTGRPRVQGDDIWLDEETLATVTPNAGGAPFRVADMATYRARLSQVLDRDRAFVDCDIAYNDTTDWPRWMKMGDRPGHRFARASGRKVASWDAMPDRWREVVAARFPAVAAKPERAMELPPFRFER